MGAWCERGGMVAWWDERGRGGRSKKRDRTSREGIDARERGDGPWWVGAELQRYRRVADSTVVSTVRLGCY